MVHPFLHRGGLRPHPQPTHEHEMRSLALARGIDADTLISEVAQFRVAMEADLTVAAAAVDEGRPDVAVDALEQARIELQNWNDTLSLEPASTVPAATAVPAAPESADRHRRTALFTTGVAGVAATIGLLSGLLASALTSGEGRPNVRADATVTGLAGVTALAGVTDWRLLASADAHYAELSRVADAGDEQGLETAALSFQDALARLVTAAEGGDRLAAQRAAQLLLLLDEPLLLASAPPASQERLRALRVTLAKRLVDSLGLTLPVLAAGGSPAPLVKPPANRPGTRLLRPGTPLPPALAPADAGPPSPQASPPSPQSPAQSPAPAGTSPAARSTPGPATAAPAQPAAPGLTSTTSPQQPSPSPPL